MKVLVIGSTGVLGRNVVPRLVESGHEVRALVRRQEQAETYQRMGIEAALGDILEPESLMMAAKGCDAALHLATAFAKMDWNMTDRIRREGTKNLLKAGKENHVTRFIQQSIIYLYGDHEDRPVDESTKLNVFPMVESAADMENQVKDSNLDWCILRGGSFYGPGTGQNSEWKENARKGTLKMPDEGRAYLSLVHVNDMARAVVQALDLAPSQKVFNVVDDHPVCYEELYQYVAAMVNGPAPKTAGERFLPSLNCKNEAIKSVLGWKPTFPSFRSGLTD